MKSTICGIAVRLIALCIFFAGPFLAAADVEVHVVVGPSAATPASTDDSPLNAPFAVCFEPDSTMWIVEYDGGRLLKLSPEAVLTHVAGDGQLGYADGSAKLAQFNKLHNIVRLADGRFVMSDHQNHALRVYDPKSDLVSTLSGSGQAGFAGDGGPVAAARFHEPICVELSSSGNELLIADIRNLRIRGIDLEKDSVRTIAGTGNKGRPRVGGRADSEPLFDPRAAISSSSGGFFVLERSGHQLLEIDRDGMIRTVAGDGAAGMKNGPALQAQMNGPKHMCLGPSGTVYIADDNNHAIRKFDPQSGTLTTVDLGSYTLKRPHGVAVWNGWLFIADSYHHRILKVKL